VDIKVQILLVYIHQGVKPANTLYRSENFYLSDYGIAKVVDWLRTLVETTSHQKWTHMRLVQLLLLSGWKDSWIKQTRPAA
jgi:serine/threonine protein kinase